MEDNEYFAYLYEIARNLNKEFSLHSALRTALEKTVELLHLETGWIWLVQEGTHSVYLAASYNLPPALSRYPERLSGNCYCIDCYLADGISEARNISEITCSRLKDITAGTRGLKFHATIPITIEGQKVGLINLVSKQTQELDEKKLSVLNSIAELISIAVQRTRRQEEQQNQPSAVLEVINRVVEPGVEELVQSLQGTKSKDRNVLLALEKAEELHRQLLLIRKEIGEETKERISDNAFHYPTSPLTNRELEVLVLVKKGMTNKQIADQLFISERTVKYHISSILSKLFAQTRTEAVETAIQRGLL